MCGAALVIVGVKKHCHMVGDDLFVANLGEICLYPVGLSAVKNCLQAIFCAINGRVVYCPGTGNLLAGLVQGRWTRNALPPIQVSWLICL